MAQSKKRARPPSDVPQDPKPRDYYSKVADAYRDIIEYEDPDDIAPPAELVTPKLLRQELLIEIFIACIGNAEAACRIARVGRRTFYRWLREPEFAARLNERKIEWEMKLHNKAMEMALKGEKLMIIFILKFLNPFYDDGFRLRALGPLAGEQINERNAIPNPQLLPPEVPERFRNAAGVSEAGADDKTGAD